MVEVKAAGAIRPVVRADPEAEGEGPEGEWNDGDGAEKLPGVDYAAIDAVLARSEAAIASATRPGRCGQPEMKKIR